jgi:hypothetical protein
LLSLLSIGYSRWITSISILSLCIRHYLVTFSFLHRTQVALTPPAYTSKKKFYWFCRFAIFFNALLPYYLPLISSSWWISACLFRWFIVTESTVR